MTVAFIPARGGSKGIYKKNIKKLNGRPLIYWSIISALESKKIDKIVVSTDDDEIINTIKNFNFDLQIDKRPDILSTDQAKTIDVLNEYAIRNPKYDSYVLLQPTSPLRQKQIIDKCISKFEVSNCEVLVSGYWTHITEYGTHQNARRQDLNEFFYDDGNIYILSKETILKKEWFSKNHIKYINTFPYVMEIDTIDEFNTLEILMKNKDEL
tara:strand:+ start:17056 stop:17688 length:633 start_codon:yes stop_codon:yes gene_type:complete